MKSLSGHIGKYSGAKLSPLRLSLIAAVALLVATALLPSPAAVQAQSPSSDATLSAISVSGEDIIGFAPHRTSYEVGVDSTVTTATVTALRPITPGRRWTSSPIDADGVARTTHQVDPVGGGEPWSPSRLPPRTPCRRGSTG